LIQEADAMQVRETNGDPTHAFEFDDAMAIAVDWQTLNDRIDTTIAGK